MKNMMLNTVDTEKFANLCNKFSLGIYTVPSEDTPIIASNIADYGGLSGTAVLDKGKLSYNPYVYICFDVVGLGENSKPVPGDASGWASGWASGCASGWASGWASG